jgi:hypothetical protein
MTDLGPTQEPRQLWEERWRLVVLGIVVLFIVIGVLIYIL